MTDIANTAVSDAQLVDVLGLDDVDELYETGMFGRFAIQTCDGFWSKTEASPLWHFIQTDAPPALSSGDAS